MPNLKQDTPEVDIAGIHIGGKNPIVLMAGPCVIESREHTLMLAREITKITQTLAMPFIFKASFDKANRSSVTSYRGPGVDEGLSILAEVKKEVGVPILTDIHLPDQAERVAEVADVLQIPAFLCRQTDLLAAAARTGKPVNVKKGQFLAPADMKNVVDKIRSAGRFDVILTERGASFGYNNLVSDMRSLVIMRELGCPVVFDATHSVQLPGGLGATTGGQRQYVAPLARAATATGIDGLFIETHEDPARALSDGPNAIPLAQLGDLLKQVIEIDKTLRGL